MNFFLYFFYECFCVDEIESKEKLIQYIMIRISHLIAGSQTKKYKINRKTFSLPHSLSLSR